MSTLTVTHAKQGSECICIQLKEEEKKLKQPFAGVRAGKPAQSDELKRRLSAMRRFVPWGSKVAFQPLVKQPEPPEEEEEEAADDANAQEPAKAAEPLPPGVEPLILWQPGMLQCHRAHASAAALRCVVSSVCAACHSSCGRRRCIIAHATVNRHCTSCRGRANRDARESG